MAKKEAGPSQLTRANRMNLTTTQVRADAQASGEQNAEEAFTYGNPITWTEEQIIQSAMRTGYQGGQASGRSSEARYATARFSELIGETMLAVCVNPQIDTLPEEEQSDARHELANKAQATIYRSTIQTCGARWDRGDRTSKQRDKQLRSGAALVSGKRQVWANALCIADRLPGKLEAILEPNRRTIHKDGSVGNTVSFEQRAKDIQSAVDRLCKQEHGKKWTDNITKLEKAQEEVTNAGKERNKMREELVGNYNLDTLARGDVVTAEWNQQLQAVIDAETAL